MKTRREIFRNSDGQIVHRVYFKKCPLCPWKAALYRDFSNAGTAATFIAKIEAV